MKCIKNAIDTLCYGAFYTRKTHPSNDPNNHDYDTLIQTEAIFIATSATFTATISFALICLFPHIVHYAPFISIGIIGLTIAAPMLLFRETRFMKVIKHYESMNKNKQLKAKKIWRIFFWGT